MVRRHAVGCLGRHVPYCVAPMVGAGGAPSVAGVWVVLCENWIVDASIFIFCSVCSLIFCVVCVFKGARWMPWHGRPMKDVRGCVKPRGAAN